MGLGKLLRKSIKDSPKVFIASATFEDWEAKPADAIKEWATAMIKQIGDDQPMYRYHKSIFEYTHDGNINFRFRFVLKEKKGMLIVAK